MVVDNHPVHIGLRTRVVEGVAVIPTLTVLQGDCLTRLAELPDNSVQCCVTSPPYFALRDYGVPPTRWPAVAYDPMVGLPMVTVPSMECCLGLEPSIDAFIGHIVLVFQQVYRVLRSDGTLWMNFGDSYNGSGLSGGTKAMENGTLSFRGAIGAGKVTVGGLKPKDMVGIPWRVAFALQAAGWYLRSDIIWHKPNPMPESVSDRPTKSHEYIFLLTKNQRYFYDAEAILEECSPNTHARLSQDVQNQVGSERANGGAKTNGTMKAVARKTATPGEGIKNNDSFDAAMAIMPLQRNKRTVWSVEDHNQLVAWLTQIPGGNDILAEFQQQTKRDVWSLPTFSYRDAHFATFPPDLIKPCILAGTSPQACEHCGAPFERQVEKEKSDSPAQHKGSSFTKGKTADARNPLGKVGEGQRTVSTTTTGWTKTCKCDCLGTAKCTVLDPFGGSGTSGAVATELGRNATLIELNPKYVPLIHQRCAVTQGLGI